jgi:PIN domain nuclease of toxin-antitoxin system
VILLDTNALIGLAEGWPFRAASREAIDSASRAGRLMVSVTSAWEIGLLAFHSQRTGALFGGDPRRWFDRALLALGTSVVPLGTDIAMEAALLPPGHPNDPADRWIIATARVLDLPLITSDRAILAYAKAGFLKAIRR